jgi:hypothetical protein
MLFESLIKPALDSVNSIINDFHLSPEDKAKAQQAIADASAKAQQSAIDYDVQLNTIASANIRADATNGDKYAARARPSFLYVIIAVLAFNYMALPLAAVFGSHVAPIVLPADLLTLFGVALCGYTMSRTAEKIAAMPGNSEISALGIKVSQKSEPVCPPK